MLGCWLAPPMIDEVRQWLRSFIVFAPAGKCDGFSFDFYRVFGEYNNLQQ